ncbi:MAG: helix-turn-helix domain-containing protein [Solirubrobacteraceae bacterium]
MSAAVAGSLVREARRRAGISQVELGRRAGVTQSVVSAYESGRRQPSLPTLAQLVRAAGLELDMVVRAAALGRSPAQASLGERLARDGARVAEIAASYGLSNVRVFGSVARGEDRGDSDVDLLVDVGPRVGLMTLARCQRDLEALLDAPVDLVPAGDLKRGVAGSALADARLV